MTDEEILRKKLDRLNENSHYGIIIDTEITKIAHILMKRLEEIKMNDIYPLVIVKDRYNGTYSGGKWTAWNLNYVPWKIDADDMECADFFSKNTIVYGRGETPEEAINDLKMILDCGISDPDEEDKDDKNEEEEKMKPTSKQVINGYNFINIYQDPDGESTRLTLKNNDDVFEIEINGHESYEAFRRLIFNDHNCKEARRKNQELCHEKCVELNEKVDILLKELERVIREKNRLKQENEELRNLLNDYLGLAENGDGVPIFSIENITPTVVSMMMALLKIVRIRND